MFLDREGDPWARSLFGSRDPGASVASVISNQLLIWVEMIETSHAVSCSDGPLAGSGEHERASIAASASITASCDDKYDDYAVTLCSVTLE